MGIVKEFYIEFFEPNLIPEEEKRQLEEERRREADFWAVDCAPRPTGLSENELRVKEKCAKAAQILRAKKEDGAY